MLFPSVSTKLWPTHCLTEGGAALYTSTSCGCSYSNIRMLPAVFSSGFNTISPMKLTVKLHTLGLSTTLPHKQVQESFYWQSHLLHSHVKHWSPFRTVYSAPTPPFTAAHPWLQSQTRREFCREIWRRHRHYRSDVRQQWEINNLAEWCTQKKLQLSVAKTKELVVDVRKEKKGKTHKPRWGGAGELFSG